MNKMINGNSVVIEFAEETAYGEPVKATDRVEVSSENFKPTVNKTDEGLLTGGIGKAGKETMSIKTESSLSTLAKPVTVGKFLKLAFGKVSDPEELENGKYKHTFTPIGNGLNEHLPAATFTVNRIAKIYSYTGNKVDSISFSASAEDRLKLDLAFIGRNEIAGTNYFTNGLNYEVARSFKFHQAKVYKDDVELADVTSIKFDYKNNLDSSTQTTGTGLYFKEPETGTREATAELEVVYSTETEEIREQYFKEDGTFKLVVEFIDNENNALTFTIPNAEISSMDPATASGEDTMKQSMSVSAVEYGTDDYVKVELINSFANKY